MTEDLSALVPITKYETGKASALVALGFPAVEPVLMQIVGWLRDSNWPVASVFQPFLASIGQPLAPYVRVVLAGEDDGWKYSLLNGVVGHSSELAQALRHEIERVSNRPSPGERREEVDQVAREILEALGG